MSEEAREIESSLMESDVVDAPTKKTIESFPAEFKDLILETVLNQIVESPDTMKKLQDELAARKQKRVG